MDVKSMALIHEMIFLKKSCTWETIPPFLSKGSSVLGWPAMLKSPANHPAHLPLFKLGDGDGFPRHFKTKSQSTTDNSKGLAGWCCPKSTPDLNLAW